MDRLIGALDSFGRLERAYAELSGGYGCDSSIRGTEPTFVVD